MNCCKTPALIPGLPSFLPELHHLPPLLAGPIEGAYDRVDGDADRPHDQEGKGAFKHGGVGNLPNNIRRGRGVILFNSEQVGGLVGEALRVEVAG